jgi:carbonic anhydrase/acetyltransferase-like protein (isoleucine patch superfamily)
MTTYDFQDGNGNGPVAAHRHSNGGGWVADTAKVEASAYVDPNAWVFGDACVYGNARVYDSAQVSCNAWVFGDARIFGNARVFEIRRSDGVFFVYVDCADGIKRIQSGCRSLSLGDAKKHWEETMGGTSLGEETMDIINHLVKWSKLK